MPQPKTLPRRDSIQRLRERQWPDQEANPRRRPLPERGTPPETRHRRPRRNLRNLGDWQSLPLPQLTENKPKTHKQPPSEKVISHFYRKKFARPFKLSRDANFVPKLVDVVGIYLSPPQNAVVLCVDEKSQIQARDRTQPGLPMK
jgi:hypothetical protein